MQEVSTPRKVGLAVSQARKASGITQVELAHACGISRQLVNRLEMGTATGIGLEKLLRVLSFLGLGLYVNSTWGTGRDDASPCHEAPSETGTVIDDQDTVEELLGRYTLDPTLLSRRHREV